MKKKAPLVVPISFRIPAELAERFEEAAGDNKSLVLRRLVEGYVRKKAELKRLRFPRGA